MKKIIIILTMALLIVTGCSNKMTTYEEITIETYKQMIEEKQSFILYIGSHECSYCKLYSKKLNQVIKDYQVKVYYIDVASFTESETTEFKTYVNYSGTPTTVFIDSGAEKSTYNRINGNAAKSKIIEKFQTNNYIKEG